MFCQKADGLHRGYENKAHDRAEEAGQKDAVFFANLLQTFPHAYAHCFQRICYSPCNGANDSPGGKDNSSDSKAIFLEGFFDPITKGQDFYYFLNICSEPCKLLFPFSLSTWVVSCFWVFLQVCLFLFL